MRNAIRLLISLYLYKHENREEKILNNKNNIENYLKLKDIWIGVNMKNKEFNEELKKIKELKIQMNQILTVYDILDDDINKKNNKYFDNDDKYFEDVDKEFKNQKEEDNRSGEDDNNVDENKSGNGDSSDNDNGNSDESDKDDDDENNNDDDDNNNSNSEDEQNGDENDDDDN